MTEWASLLAAGLFGAMGGAVYFGLLWSSVRRLPSSQNPWLAFFIGGLARLIVLSGSFAVLLILDAGAPHLLAWLAGFIIIRLVSVRRSQIEPSPGSRERAK